MSSISFTGQIHKLGINPCVDVPSNVIEFFGKTKIPVIAEINKYKFKTTIIKYSGEYRLYINGLTIKGAKVQVGDVVNIEIEYNPIEEKFPVPSELKEAFIKDKKLKVMFDKLAPYRRKEILRYLGFLKTSESRQRIVNKLIKDDFKFFPRK